MRTLAGPTGFIAFTNLSSATSASLSAAFSNTNISDSNSASPAQAQAECYRPGVRALMKSRDVDIPLEQVCLLDPKASLALTPSDGDAGKFTWFLFGVRPRPSPFPPIHRSFSFLSFFLFSFTTLILRLIFCAQLALFLSIGWDGI
jgi:hypothetical protein